MSETRSNVECGETLIEVLAEFAAAGWGGSFWVRRDGSVLCGTCRHELAPHGLDVQALRRAAT
jgi:hypothetical protein